MELAADGRFDVPVLHVVTGVKTFCYFRKESYNISTNHHDPSKGPGSNTTIITTALASDHNIDTTPPASAKDMESRAYEFIYAKPGKGGWEPQYIRDKIALYADGGKGGDKQDLIDYTAEQLRLAAVRSARSSASHAATTTSPAATTTNAD